MDVKIGITIGYAFDFIGFVVLFLAGSFDSKYKSSRAALEALVRENDFLQKTLRNLQSVRTMNISTDHMTGAPTIGTGITDPSSLTEIQQEITLRDRQILELQKRHDENFRYYLLVFDKAPHIGVCCVMLGIAFQWWFSSYGAA